MAVPRTAGPRQAAEPEPVLPTARGKPAKGIRVELTALQRRHGHSSVSDEKMTELFHNGLTNPEIAARTGLSLSSVRIKLRRLKLRRPTTRHYTMNVSDEAMREAWEEGGSYKTIGQRVGMSASGVRLRLIDLGLEPNTPRGGNSAKGQGKRRGTAIRTSPGTEAVPESIRERPETNSEAAGHRTIWVRGQDEASALLQAYVKMVQFPEDVSAVTVKGAASGSFRRHTNREADFHDEGDSVVGGFVSTDAEASVNAYIDRRAVVGPGAEVAQGVWIEALSLVREGSRVGRDAYIGESCTVSGVVEPGQIITAAKQAVRN